MSAKRLAISISSSLLLMSVSNFACTPPGSSVQPSDNGQVFAPVINQQATTIPNLPASQPTNTPVVISTNLSDTNKFPPLLTGTPTGGLPPFVSTPPPQFPISPERLDRDIQITTSGKLAGQLDAEPLSRYSDVIIEGRIKSLETAQWNTPDGQPPTTLDPDVVPGKYAIYTPVIVEITETLKGKDNLSLRRWDWVQPIVA